MTWTNNMGWVYPSKPTSHADFHYRWFNHGERSPVEDKPWELQWYDDATMQWIRQDFFATQQNVFNHIKEKSSMYEGVLP